MKIAMFLDEFPTLTETFILNQITGLLERGHEVDLFARWRGQYSRTHAAVAQYGLASRTTYMVPEPHHPVRRALEMARWVMTTPHWWSPAGMRAAHRIADCRRRADRAPTLDLIRLASRTLHRRYDIIHCQYATIGRRVLPMIRMGLISGPLVTSVRGHDVTDRTRTEPGYASLFSECARFLPVSRSLEGLLVDLGCPEDKIEVHRSGIDCAGFRYRERGYVRADAARAVTAVGAAAAGVAAAGAAAAGTAGGEPIRVITVARHVEMKGLEYAIRAVARLISAGHDLEYHLVGDGPRRARLEALVRECGIESRVRMHGALTHDQVIRRLDAADLFLMPSVTTGTGQAEGIPNALKEAMMSGLVVVATDHGGIPELVENGVSGLLVPERDAGALAARLDWLIRNRGCWAGLSRAAHRRVRDEYDKETLNDRLVDIYQSVR